MLCTFIYGQHNHATRPANLWPHDTKTSIIHLAKIYCEDITQNKTSHFDHPPKKTNKQKQQQQNQCKRITLFQCAGITAGMRDCIGVTVNAPLGNKTY